VTADKLRSLGIHTVAEVAALEERSLVAMLGPASGRHLHALAHNRDPRPVVVGRRRRSIGSQSALGRHGLSRTDLDARLIELVDRVCRRLRSAGRVCRTVVIRLRFADYTRVTRSHTLPAPTQDTAVVLAALRQLLQAGAELIAERGITLIGVALANLDDDRYVQMPLPFADAVPAGLDAALDEVRQRYGSASITRGVLLGGRTLPEMPMLPD
jgi:DNA polymerase-4